MSRYSYEFIRGFREGSGLSAALVHQAYEEWLDSEGYAEIYRIDLEAGGYEAGFEVGLKWRETNQSTFVCPDCGAVSHNPNDIEHRYCGRCHEFKD